MTSFKTIEWTGASIKLLDQTLLPNRKKIITIRDEKAMWEAIRALRVRGAPAIGVAAAFGLYLGVVSRKPTSEAKVRSQIRTVARYLATSRPTAVNLFWALDRCQRVTQALPKGTSPREILGTLLAEAIAIQREDEATCEAMARHGAPLLTGLTGVLTHCNTGALATAGCGTALGVIIRAAQKTPFTVFADETRPLLQGARLTVWELLQAGVETRLITDSMAATVLDRKMAQAVIVGSDRIAANGDAANKIGTMPLAIVAKHFGVPFYVVAPLSTFDPQLKSGDLIPIEERGAGEIVHFGEKPVAPKGTKVFSPAFDVTPAKLISGIVTEVGVLRPPYRSSIRRSLKLEV